MATSAPVAFASTTAPRRRWRQFSLLNLLLVTVIVCVAAAYSGSKHELEQAKRELQKQQLEIDELGDQIGILVVPDENKIYLQARSTYYNPDPHWRWRVFLPKLSRESIWRFEHRSVKVDSMGLGSKRGGGEARLEGQFDLEINVQRQLDGSAWLFLTAETNGQSFNYRLGLSEEEVQSLRRLGTRGTQVGGRQLVVASADERLELLRVVSTGTPGEQIGLLVFLEKHTPTDRSTRIK